MSNMSKNTNAVKRKKMLSGKLNILFWQVRRIQLTHEHFEL